ncbi:hypothetical protein PHMEG_00012955 [Phytophthora megakarya]|uniref:Uncharacterized protein n=1 Tax=Phytophthora megakarya TaxID=4795 RepID=A0A225W7Y4_9STRA|nr:hypothetical protein PHMEG_00012955 [Phytophthora megakarya]
MHKCHRRAENYTSTSEKLQSNLLAASSSKQYFNGQRCGNGYQKHPKNIPTYSLLLVHTASDTGRASLKLEILPPPVSLQPGHQLVISGMRRSDPPCKPKFPITTDI